MMKVIRECGVCKSTFYEFPYRVKLGYGRFCSMKCKGIWQANKFKDKTKHPRWNSVKIKCETCGNELFAPKNHNRKFCSRKCYEVSKRKKKILTHCIVCGKEKLRFPCEIEYGKRFCSRRCAGLHNITKTRTKDTSIEMQLEWWLRQHNIQYKKQVRIKNIAVVDFYIEPNICLFADGDYWHRPEINKGKDIRQNNKLKEEGYEVMRIWEHDIKAGVRPVNLLERRYAEV